MTSLLELNDQGLYCAAGDFYIDPWKPVARAVITHAHGDHARWGSKLYVTATEGLGVLQQRMGPEAKIETLAYNERRTINGVTISLHPAGHVLGSAQVRVEHRGEVCVVSGDYKLDPDPTCRAFEPVRCDTFFSECTFGLPLYRWPSSEEVMAEVHRWWCLNVERGRTSVVFAYAFGKAQRLLSALDPSIGPILLHGAVVNLMPGYESAGLRFPPWAKADEENARASQGKALVLAPPSAIGTPWMRKFGETATAFASGWMQVRGKRRQKNIDKGFILSDHADWNGLLQAISATEASEVIIMHGQSAPLVRYLQEKGIRASQIATPYEDEEAPA